MRWSSDPYLHTKIFAIHSVKIFSCRSPSDYRGPAVDQDEAGAGDELGQLQPLPPGEGGHVQDLHRPHHTATTPVANIFDRPLNIFHEVANLFSGRPELLCLGGCDPAHHHDLGLAALGELDAGVVHPCHAHPGHSTVQYRTVQCTVQYITE